jgi:Putative phage tail protein
LTQTVLTVAGFALGNLVVPGIGGQIGAALGAYIGGSLEAKKQRYQGPRLSDAQVTTAAYGDVIPWIAGCPRIAGQIWWASERREIATSTSQGKGGGPTTTNFTYEQDVLFGLCDVVGVYVSRIWANGRMIWSALSDASTGTIEASIAQPMWSRLTVYDGSSDQLPDPTYEAAVGTANATAYRGRMSIFLEAIQLGNSGQMPNFTFEVCKVGVLIDFNSAKFWAPLTVNTTDVIAPSAGSATLSGGYTPTFSSTNGVSTVYDGSTWTSFAWSATTKMRPSTYPGEKFSVQVEMTVSLQTALNGNAVHIMRVNDTTTQVGFDLYRNAGSLQIYSLVVNTLQGGQLDFTSLGVAPAHGVYKIEFVDSVATPGEVDINWYIDDVLLRTKTYTWARISPTNASIGLGNAGATLMSATFKDFKMWVGDLAATTLVTPGTETVRAVTEALCARAGMAASTYDASALDAITTPVRAMTVAQVGETRGSIEALQNAYFFDCAATDKLYFRPRAAASVATIPYGSLAAGLDNAAPEALPIVQASELELPGQVAVTYINVSNDLQMATELSDRLLGGQVAQHEIHIPLGLLPSEAKIIADGALVSGAAGLTTGSFSVGMAYARLEPADPVTVTDSTGRTYRVRLGRKTDASGVIAFEFLRDDLTSLISAGTTDGTYEESTTVAGVADTAYLALDIPLLRDEDDDPGYYVVAHRDADGGTWPGCSYMVSADDIEFTVATEILEEATFGTCGSTLGNWTGLTVMDELNNVSVNVGDQTLSSVTRDVLLTDPEANAMLIGSEIIRFCTATLTASSPNVYTLTRLLRGQRGTEWAMTGHIASEDCVLLRPTGMRRVVQSVSEIGAIRHVKAVTTGLPAAAVESAEFTNTGVYAMPFSPYSLRGTRAVNGDMVMTWIRRTRLSTGFVGFSAPLGEVSEAYDIVIYTSSAFTTIKRTLTSTTPTVNYTADLQASDFGSIQSSIFVRVHQVSAVVGQGYALQGTLSATLPSYFAPSTTNDRKAPLVGAGARAVLQREGTSGGAAAEGLYSLAIGEAEPSFSMVLSASAAAPYAPGIQLAAADPATGQVVILMRNQGNSSTYRKLLYGTPGALLQVTPAFMPADPPCGLAWVSNKFIVITVTGIVWHSTDLGATWASQGAKSGGPSINPDPLAFADLHMRLVGGKLVMRYGNEVYYNSDLTGVSWTAATGDIASLPTGTYVNGLKLYSLAAADAADAAIILGVGRDAINAVYGLIYSTTDGITWALQFEEEIGNPSYNPGIGHLLNYQAYFYVDAFLVNMWPLSVGGTAQGTVATFDTIGAYDITFNYKATLMGVATATGIIAAGDGTTGFDTNTLYTSPDGLVWTLLDWE